MWARRSSKGTQWDALVHHATIRCMTTHQKPVLYSRQEAADMLRISLSTVGREIRSGRLRSFRAGRSIRVSAEALQQYMDGDIPGEEPAPEGREDTTTYPPTPSLFYSPENED